MNKRTNRQTYVLSCATYAQLISDATADWAGEPGCGQDGTGRLPRLRQHLGAVHCNVLTLLHCPGAAAGGGGERPPDPGHQSAQRGAAPGVLAVVNRSIRISCRTEALSSPPTTTPASTPASRATCPCSLGPDWKTCSISQGLFSLSGTRTNLSSGSLTPHYPPMLSSIFKPAR